MYIRLMNFHLLIIMNFTILFPGIIGLLRYQMINSRYYPFIYFSWLAALNEVLNFILIMNRIPNNINNNFYVLGASMLILYFLKTLVRFHKLEKVYAITFTVLALVWVVENIIMWKIMEVGVIFRICYSFAVVLFAVNGINHIITTNRGHIFKNADFLICVCFIMYYTFRVLVE